MNAAQVVLRRVRARAEMPQLPTPLRHRQSCRMARQASPAHPTRQSGHQAVEARPVTLPAQPDPVLYRKATEALLLRYTSMSLDAGRVPSLMGREFFPGNVSHARRTGFDDFVHFVHDFAHCLKLLSPGQQYLLRRIAMHGYTQPEVAAMVGVSLRTIGRRYAEAVDRLTTVLLERKLLQPNSMLGPDEAVSGN